MNEKLLWIIDHLKAIAGIFACALVLVTGLALYLYKPAKVVLADYRTIGETYEQWIKAESLDRDSLTRLTQMIDQHPELHARFDGPMAQRLLVWSDGQDAERLALASLKRTEGSCPEIYQQFSKHSLLIGMGAYQAALVEAKKLQTTLNETAEGSMLHAMNLLRIAMLEKETGSAAGELSALQAFEKTLKHKEENNLLLETMRDREVSLTDYIGYRKTLINHNLK